MAAGSKGKPYRLELIQHGMASSDSPELIVRRCGSAHRILYEAITWLLLSVRTRADACIGRLQHAAVWVQSILTPACLES